MIAFFTALFGAIHDIPLIAGWINSAFALWDKVHQAKQLAKNSENQSEMNKAQTEEEIKKAARDQAQNFHG